MKHFFKFLLTLSLFCMAISLSSCRDDDKEENIEVYDHAAKIAGEYVGTIEVTYFGQTLTKSKGSKLILRRSSNDFVIATFYYADGTQVFNNSQAYEITKTSGGTYVLDCNESSIDRIRIDDKKATTEDAYVTISGEVCDFSFEGTMQ